MTGLAISETLVRSKSQKQTRTTDSVTSVTLKMLQPSRPLSNRVTTALAILVISTVLSSNSKQVKLKTTHLLKPLEVLSSQIQLSRKTVDLEVLAILTPVFQSQRLLKKSPNRIQLIINLLILALLSHRLPKRSLAMMVLVTSVILVRLQNL